MDVRKIVDDLKQRLAEQAAVARRVDSWIEPGELGFDLSPKAQREHKRLAELARTPWLGLVVTTMAQAMRVGDIVSEGYRVDPLYRLWVENGLTGSQMALYRAVFAYGSAYIVVSPAMDGRARIRFKGPRAVAVKYSDPTDLYPAYALERAGRQGKKEKFFLYEPGVTHTILCDTSYTADPVVIESVETGLDVIPVVQVANIRDLDGEITGEVTPLIPTAQRINKTLYDRLLIQHFNSWRVRYATGLELPRDEIVSEYEEFGTTAGVVTQGEINAEDVEKLKLDLSHDDVLVSEDADTRFGTLEATDMGPIIAAFTSDIETLAAVSQTPVHAFTAQQVNLSGDALAEARAPLTQKISERQEVIGDALVRALKIAAVISGHSDIAEDVNVAISWRDMEIRSLSQAADALGKLSQMLKIPARGLWQLVPGATSADIAAWTAMLDEDLARDPLTLLSTKHSAAINIDSSFDDSHGDEAI